MCWVAFFVLCFVIFMVLSLCSETSCDFCGCLKCCREGAEPARSSRLAHLRSATGLTGKLHYGDPKDEFFC